MAAALGADVHWIDDNTLVVRARTLNSPQIPSALATKMRGSFLVVGPLLARFGSCEVPLPGGCVIGHRPVDFHVQGFKALGAHVEERNGVVRAKASRLRGTRIFMDPRMRSVGATVNIMLAAVLAVCLVLTIMSTLPEASLALSGFCVFLISLYVSIVLLRDIPRHIASLLDGERRSG